jgi:chromosome segregation ATPase
MAKWKFDWLKAKAPEAAEVALAAAEAKSEGDVAARAALQDLVKKEAETGAVIETAEAPAEAEKDAPVEEVSEELEIDPEGLAELLTEMAEKLEAVEKREAKEATVDMAPVEKGFADVNAAFVQVQKERDEMKTQIKELNDKLDIVAGALERLIGLQPRATQKEFAVQYRASEAPETVISKETSAALAAVKPTDSFTEFAKWAGIPA